MSLLKKFGSDFTTEHGKLSQQDLFLFFLPLYC